MIKYQSLLWLFLAGPVVAAAGFLLMLPVMLPPRLRFRARPYAILLIVVGAVLFVGGFVLMATMPAIVVRRL